MNEKIKERANQIVNCLMKDERLMHYVDASLSIPDAYQGSGQIKLIMLGQDPTVRNANSRKKIKTVLNLDKNGSVTKYLSSICRNLGINLRENVYATNVYKNFFKQPPTTIKEIDVFSVCIENWLPLLQDELAVFGDVPIISLGEPILNPLVKPDMAVSGKVRKYWGYHPEWRKCKSLLFGHIKACENKLSRRIFPFPHQPSLRKEFYKVNLMRYTLYMKNIVFKNR